VPCACTQQFSGVRQPCAIKRGGGFPLQCVSGVAALLFPTQFLRVSVGLCFLNGLDAGRSADRQDFGTTPLVLSLCETTVAQLEEFRVSATPRVSNQLTKFVMLV
jgi:hypothetical protein